MPFLQKISATFSDADLVTLYKEAGSMEVLGKLYSRYMELVYGVCLKYLKEPEDAKDSVINIFEELVTKLKKYEVVHFKGWLYQLAKNHCLMKLRADKAKPFTIEVGVVHLVENMHPEDAMLDEENFEAMELCINQLPEEQKNAIQLFYLQQKCYKEIAEVTDTDINKIRSYIQNGRRNLKICMDNKALQKHNNARQ